MKALFLAILSVGIAEIGIVHNEGHCLDKRAMVLTEAEAVELIGLAARAEDDAARITDLNAQLVAAKRETASEADSGADALEGKAAALDTVCPVTKCECDRWTMGLAGVGVGLLSCGSFWIGAEL